MNLDGCWEADREVQAEAFADHYGASQVLSGIPFDISSSLDHWNRDFSITELNSAIALLKPSSPGEDKIPASLYKSLNSNSRLKLLKLHNFLFHGGIVPDEWRTAVIIPIWKQGRPKELVSSYRPIALTPVGCKLMEKMLLKRLLDWVMENNCFHNRHFGFLPGRDCSKALAVFQRDIQDARNQKLHAVAVKLDVDSAYDSVWHDGLMHKLASLGIGGDVALWIARWLSARRVKVRWRGCTSSPVGSSRGVPQGSVLSPFLFMVFMWDFFEVLDSHVKVIMYADDIILYFFGLCLMEVLRKLQEMLNRIQRWCEHWHLNIRADKCAAIHFFRSSQPPEVNLQLGGSNISWLRNVKILGLTFSSNLTFSGHFGIIQRRCLQRLNIIKAFASARWGIRALDLVRMTNALIRGVIEYAAPLYKVACKSSLKVLDVLYNSALRISTGLPKWTPLLKLYRESGQVPLGFRRSFLTDVFSIRCATTFPQPDDLQLYLPTDFQWITLEGSVAPSRIIPSSWPSGAISDYVEIFIDEFDFQSRALPSASICAAFAHSMQTTFAGYHIIATDASKDTNKTSIAAVDGDRDVGRACLVSHLNSVFTAECLAIGLGLGFMLDYDRYILLTDCRSALEALRSVHPKSAAVTLQLFHTIRAIRPSVEKLVLMWVPGHVGIPANEEVDRLAKVGPFSLHVYGGVSPEDLGQYYRRQMWNRLDEWWLNGKYAADSQFLGPAIYKWSSHRREDVAIARLRTLSMPTEYRLYKYRLRPSPLCTICSAGLGTERHYVFECRAFDSERDLLMQHMNILTFDISWSYFWSIVEDDCHAYRLFVNLFLGTGRF